MSETLFDPSVKKKKKSSKSKPAFVTEDEEASSSAPPSEQVESLDLEPSEFEFKKKKKKSKGTATAVDDFEAALQKAGVDDLAVKAEEKEALAPHIQRIHGLELEIGYQSPPGSDENSYERMVDRFFEILRINNPEMASDRQGVKYKIPPPIVLRDGKKTIFANIKQISDKMHRSTEHVIQFLFAELGTTGSVDGAQRLIIKGKFQQKGLEGVLRRYIQEYVQCKTCKSVNTTLMKENRLYFLECNSCGSRRSVQSIKSGYHAVTRDDRKKAHAAS